MDTLLDEKFMQRAIKEAELAFAEGEVPIGAVVVDGDGNLIASAHNHREGNRMATAHAELLAIEEACRKKNTWRLCDCTVYVTLEPCPMCAGTISNARIKRLVFGANNLRFGACGSLLNLFSYPMESIPEITSGVLREECLRPLQEFFDSRRKTPPYQSV